MRSTAGRADELQRAMLSALERDPGAPLTAIGEYGYFVAVPESVPVGDHPIVPGRSMFDFVAATDRLSLIDAWDQAGRDGSSEVAFHLSNTSERTVVAKFFDVRATHGVFVGLIVGADESDFVVSRPMPGNLACRLLRMKADASGIILEIDESVSEMLGWASAQMVGHRKTEFLHPDDLDLAVGMWFEMLDRPGATSRLRCRHSHSDGSWSWFDVTNHNFLKQSDACVVVEMIDISDEVSAVEALRSHERLLNGIAEALPIGVMYIESNGHIRYANRRLGEILGAEPSTANIADQLVALTEADRRRFGERLDAARRGADGAMEMKMLSKDGVDRFCLLSFRWLPSEVPGVDQTIGAAIVTATDITDRTLAEQDALRGYRQLGDAQRIAHLGSFVHICGSDVLEASEEMCRLLGLPPGPPISLAAALQAVHPDDRDRIGAAIRRSLTDHEPMDAISRLLLADGTLRWIHARATWRLDEPDGVQRAVGTVLDITEQRVAEDSLAFGSAHDALTGLDNRASFTAKVDDALRRIGPRAEQIAIVLFDLDDFKTVNDSLGHPVGDELLVALSRRVTSLARTGDTVARFGGDEFAFLVEAGASQRVGEAIAGRITEAVVVPFILGQHEVSLTASIGIAVSAPGQDSAALLRDADLAMYLAKRNGKHRTEIARPGMQEEALSRLGTLTDLRHALAHNELEVYYQGVVRTHDSALAGAEALIRWHHPSRGLLGPVDFIELAESSGLINGIGRWVRRQACQQVVEWRNAGVVDERFQISVNLSPRQLAEDTLLQHVVEDLRDSSLPAEALVLEITESVLISDLDAGVARLHQLKTLGLLLAIDDYGTGYSSLSRLADLPIDIIKIDKSFVDRLPSNVEGLALVRSVIDAATTLGMATVAEGVEDRNQLDALDKLGCTFIQGYLFAKPLPASEAEVLFRKLGRAEGIRDDPGRSTARSAAPSTGSPMALTSDR